MMEIVRGPNYHAVLDPTKLVSELSLCVHLDSEAAEFTSVPVSDFFL
jgi:hypothetical protein